VAPRLSAAGAVRGWRSQLYLRNEEWKALLAYGAAVGFLLIKASS
jgi:hypothetical protein